jgi:hypothetical protein
MRKVALVSTFCSTEEKIEVLKNTLMTLASLGIDSIIITPIEIPFSVIKMATHCFITRDNPIIDWPEYATVFWKHFSDNGSTVKLDLAVPDYGFAGAWQVKKLSDIALTYEYDRFYHLIYDLSFDSHVIDALRSDDMTCNIWPFHRGNFKAKAGLTFMAFDRSNLVSAGRTHDRAALCRRQEVD